MVRTMLATAGGGEKRGVPRGVIALSLTATAILAVQLARMSVYMVDPAATGWSVMPWNEFGTLHNCFTGYWAAARDIDTNPNVWGADLNTSPGPTPGSRVPKRLGPFAIDQYEYTPTFLIVPRALMWLIPDFDGARTVWYILNLVIVGAAILAVARRLEPAIGPAVIWLAPLILVPLSILVTFQGGNVQLACIAGSLLAMLWLERAHGAPSAALLYPAGAFLLAYMTVSKLYPGMLIVYLLCRGDWRAVRWTGTAAVLLVLVGLVELGLPAHLAFFDHLPHLLSGETFPNLRNPNGISANMSVPGLVRKLSIYGLPWSSFDAMRLVGWIYTVFVLAVVVHLARARRSTALEPIVWLVILLLATFRSPVLPIYGIFPIVWLVTILLAAQWDSLVVRWVLLVWFVALALLMPSWTLWPPAVHAIVTSVVLTVGSMVLAAAALRLKRPLQPAGDLKSQSARRR